MKKDYDPLLGPSPQEQMQDLTEHLSDLAIYGCKQVVILQSLSQTKQAHEERTQTGVLEHFQGQHFEDNFPYGEGFTADGMCRWDTFIRPFRAMACMHEDKLVMVDEYPMFSEHQHKCRACRERIAGLVQDVEGDLLAEIRYGNRQEKEKS